MQRRSLADWLCWQETLNPLEIDLGLDRVRAVAERLQLQPPQGSVFLIAGTNGKGSVVSSLEHICRANGLKSGSYTSPHLFDYNERVCLSGEPVADEKFVDAFDAIEKLRGDMPLTYFEYGTLAAFKILSDAQADVWIIEVGLGGRLDATNIIEPDFSLITTIDFDHQDFLGDTLAEIAYEKAGILRANGKGFFGDYQVPMVISKFADSLPLELKAQGDDFGFKVDRDSWEFFGESVRIEGLPLPPGSPEIQLKNQSLALAALEAWRPELLADKDRLYAALEGAIPEGRFQVLVKEHNVAGVVKRLEWVLDVGHNPQAIRALGANLDALPAQATTVVLGMLEDKDVTAVVACLRSKVERWIVTDVTASRGQTAADLAIKLAAEGVNAEVVADNAEAFELASDTAPSNSRVLVCGSFFVVGPVMQWLSM